MTLQEWESKVRKLELDHVAAGGFISREDAEKVVEQAFGPKPATGNAEESSASSTSRQS
jgi:hypothetical protein